MSFSIAEYIRLIQKHSELLLEKNKNKNPTMIKFQAFGWAHYDDECYCPQITIKNGEKLEDKIKEYQPKHSFDCIFPTRHGGMTIEIYSEETLLEQIMF